MNLCRFSPPLLIAALLTLLAGGCSEQGSGSGEATGKPVVVLKTYAVTLHDRVEALGTAQAGEAVTITARVAGRLEEVAFSDGQLVRKGDLIVRMDQDEEQAQLAAAEAQLAEHKREIQRLETLLSRKAAAGRDLDERRTLAAISASNIQEIRARIAELTLTAPFDGRLGIRRVSPGALVQPGTVITTLDAAGAIKLDFTIPSTQLQGLKAGSAVEATGEAQPGKRFTGLVSAIDSRIDPVTRSIFLRAVIDNTEGLLLPGSLMRVVLRKNERQAVVVPEEAVTQKQEKHLLTLVGADGRAELRAVEIGLRAGGLVEISRGLKAGELVVVRGMGFVQNGKPVSISETWTAIPERDGAAEAAR
jgi:membrane fusion protein (multidrug efflux system)